jgi:[acyl-carrier-protein] S-malonyltransferase
MGQALAENYPAAAAIFRQADEILGVPLSRLCFEGPAEELNDTINTQAAIFVTSIATLAALRAAGYEAVPRYVAGHSLGEYSAYVAAGVLSFEACLPLVRERGRLMKKAGQLNPGGMAVLLKLEDDVVAQICQEVTAEGNGSLQIANYNSPGQVAVSGHQAAVERGIERAKALKGRAMKLPVSVATHSALMSVVATEFGAAVDNITLQLPQVPVVANITARPLEPSLEAIRAEMKSQLTAPVCWADSMRWMAGQGITELIEIGPKNVLTSLAARIDERLQAHPVGTPADVAGLLARE